MIYSLGLTILESILGQFNSANNKLMMFYLPALKKSLQVIHIPGKLHGPMETLGFIYEFWQQAKNQLTCFYMK